MSFSGLALELRLQIWEFAIEEPRTFELYLVDPPLHPRRAGKFAFRVAVKSERFNDVHPAQAMALIRRSVKLPLLLQICQESRRLGLTIYKKFSLGGYINSTINKILITPDLFESLGWHSPGSQLPELTQVEHVALYFPNSYD